VKIDALIKNRLEFFPVNPLPHLFTVSRLLSSEVIQYLKGIFRFDNTRPRSFDYGNLY